MGEFETTQKKYEFLYQYFMQNEASAELKQQFLLQHQLQQQQQQQGNETDLELEFLSDFYQQRELKKVNSYDFLLQYYRKNEDGLKQHNQQLSFSASKKPTIEFLLQYYQLNESKKFFQLAASPQTKSQPSSQQPNATTDEPNTLIGLQEQQQLQEKKVKVEQTEHLEEVQENCIDPDGTQGCPADANDLLPPDEKLNNNHINININEAQRMLSRDTKENDVIERRDMALEQLNQSNEPINGDKQKSLNDKPQYFQNLEDFLDATMIENNSQMLTFNDDENPSPRVESIKSNDCLPLDTTSVQLSAPSKQNKRLRTTILPDQLNFLYECYQTESNPSRKMLEEISKKVNLKKRVVQVSRSRIRQCQSSSSV